MDIFGGFFIIVWMAGLFLTIIWFVLPFVIFGIKSRCDELVARVTALDSRLIEMQRKIDALSNLQSESTVQSSILANRQELK